MAHEHFRTPRALPVLALVTCVVLLSQQSARVWLLGAGILVLGVARYAVTRRFRGTPAEDAASPGSRS